MSLTDVWSAIRNSCAKQLGHITPYLPNKYQEELFKILVTVSAVILFHSSYHICMVIFN